MKALLFITFIKINIKKTKNRWKFIVYKYSLNFSLLDPFDPNPYLELVSEQKCKQNKNKILKGTWEIFHKRKAKQFLRRTNIFFIHINVDVEMCIQKDTREE